MSQYTRQKSASLMIFGATALLSLAACGKDDSDALNSDSALGRDLAMAGADTAAQPRLQDVPTTPPPSTPSAAPTTTTRRPSTPARTTPPRTNPAVTPAPTPAPAGPTSGTIAAGTALRFAANNKVCSNTNAVGDKFTATLASSVEGTNGISIPEGATGTFEVTEAKTAKNANDKTSMSVKLLSITFNGRTYPVDATVTTASTTRVRSATTGDDAKKVIGGAVIGAIAGQVIGKDTKGTVIGAAAGAAAGTAAAAATGNYDTCLNSGAAIAVRLDESATIRVASN
jgi:uncharacterized protein YcfJ